MRCVPACRKHAPSVEQIDILERFEEARPALGAAFNLNGATQRPCHSYQRAGRDE